MGEIWPILKRVRAALLCLRNRYGCSGGRCRQCLWTNDGECVSDRSWVPQSRHSSSHAGRLVQDEPLLCPVGSDSADCAVRLCSAGEYKSGRSCYSCSAGRYQSDNNHEHTSCRSCPAGKEDSSSRTGCSWCAVGTYDRSDRTSCNSCPSGQTSNQGSDSIADCMSMTCSQGEYVSGASCLSCPVGQYQTSVSTGKPHDFERSERAAARKSHRG